MDDDDDLGLEILPTWFSGLVPNFFSPPFFYFQIPSHPVEEREIEQAGRKISGAKSFIFFSQKKFFGEKGEIMDIISGGYIGSFQ